MTSARTAATKTGQPTRKEEEMNARRIEGAVALVTGANRGIGRALTEALLSRGVKKVYATARNPEALRALRDERLVSLRLDVTDADQIRAAAEAAADVELVFNNAGVALASGIADSTDYSASKAALHSLTQAARILLGAQGTSVFGVYAGPVDTDMSRELAFPKTSPRDVAFAILDGIEAGQEDIFPDPFAVDFGRRFQSSPKASERQVAAMVSGETR
jgi:NAD(P)-dependent dehydrogenase (short-subunit alcohol dehydrogenase family)